MNKKTAIFNIVVPILTVIVIFSVWLISSLSVADEIILPTPFAVFEEVIELLKTNRFYQSYFNTLLRSVVAFLVSFVLAFIFAIISKFSSILRKIIETIIPIIRALPTIAVVLLLVLWVDSSVAPVVVTTLVVLPTMYTSLLEAINEVDSDIIVMCKVYKISLKRQIFEVYLPMILPTVIVAIGTGLSLNLKLMVAAEVLSSTARSMGILLQESKIYFETANMFALVLISVITGLIFEVTSNVISKGLRRKR
ncbi:MAG: ABC transporter permease subunit [Clostridiales bacterium]|nr:ABC transporter permease subunit [Clostridiales bacterium]